MAVQGLGGGVRVVRAAGSPYWAVARRLFRLLSIELQTHGVVVVDVRRLAPDTAELLTGLLAAPGNAGGWPVASLHVVAAPATSVELVRRGLGDLAAVHPDLESALAAARREQPSRRTGARLAASRHAPQRARRIVARICAGRVPDEVAEDAALVVSELATNAVRHTGHAFSLGASLTRERLVVAVHDTSPRPLRADPDRGTQPADHDHRHELADQDLGESGRGLTIVDAVSDHWGFFDCQGDGKTVWSSFDLVSSDGADSAEAVPDHFAESGRTASTAG